MGNAILPTAAAGGGRKVTIMKINGELFKLTTPAKVGDIIDSHPGHVLLDSDEFLRINLRARPLDPEFHLQPKKIYLLVEMPRFPTSEVADNSQQRTNSADTSPRPENFCNSQVSDSDLGGIARAEAVRVKLKLPRAQVERILEQSSDDAEAAERIMDLCTPATALAADVEDEEEESARKGRCTEIGEDETTEKASFRKCRVKINHKLRNACSGQHSNFSKYKQLRND